MSNTKGIMQMERSKHNRSRSMSGPCAHATRDTTKTKCIKFHGIFKREK